MITPGRVGKGRIGTAVLVLFSALIVAFALGREFSSANELPLKIGVVDLGRLFKDYKRAQELEGLINSEKDTWDQRIKKQRNDIEAKNKQLEALNPRSKQYQQMAEDRDLEAERLRIWQRKRNRDIKDKFEQYTLEILDDIQKAVEEVGKDAEYSLVFRAESEEVEQLRLMMGFRNVLYFNASVDITDTVITILHRDYKPGSRDGK